MSGKCINTCKGIVGIPYHPWLTEIPAPDRGPGNDITNEGLKLQTIGRQLMASLPGPPSGAGISVKPG